MEQIYMVEIFIDKVSIFLSEHEENVAPKKLTMKVKFGPKNQFIIKEGQLAKQEATKGGEVIECDEQKRRKFTRTIRVGKSMLFPSYPDTLLKILSSFPLELEVWDDDEKEHEIFVGIGTMLWDTEFFFMLKDSSDLCKRVEPLSIKQITPLMAECCCKQVGEVHFILRLSALGDSIITEFQQLMKFPDSFVFRTNRAPSMFQCQRIEEGDPNFCMVGSLYETTTLEDPTTTANADDKLEICTELQSCGAGNDKSKCPPGSPQPKEKPPKTYAIDKIRMGDITGPCGNTNCVLAQKVKTYIRNLDSYKKQAASLPNKDDKVTKKVCGACVCKDDRWHRGSCSESAGGEVTALCKGCGGQAKPGHTCDEQEAKLGVSSADRTVAYVTLNVTDVPDFKDALNVGNSKSVNVNSTNIGRGCCCGKPKNLQTFQNNPDLANYVYSDVKSIGSNACCGCNKSRTECVSLCTSEEKSTKSVCNMADHNNPYVYNVAPITDAMYQKCTNRDEKDCYCEPPKPKPPCSTFDCECISKGINLATRKRHKPFCPLYKHKPMCPVSRMHEDQDEEKKKNDDDEDDLEPLPYGLPPIELGPCPVMGRPCTVPDGFARMYRIAEQPPQPPSYSDAGKVCCSKEFERIKKALQEYMRYEKDDDFRCVNKFDVDTDRRCCDKEQMLLAMTGKACCGSHKIAIQEKFKETKN